MKRTFTGTLMMVLLLFSLVVTAGATAVNIPMDAASWGLYNDSLQPQPSNSSVWAMTSDGIQINGMGYRQGTFIIPVGRTMNFAGQTVWIKYKVNGGSGNYMGVYIGFGNYGVNYTTHHSYNGSRVLPADVWLFTRITVSSTYSVRAVTALNNYDDQGGSVSYDDTAFLAEADVQGDITVGIGDNYGGTSAWMVVGEVSYSSLPTVATGPATGMDFQSAVLTGTANPNNLATSVYFNYGKTDSYGMTSGTQNFDAGTNAMAVNGPVAGLSPATTYHFQIVAVNSSGTSVGLDQTFATLTPTPRIAISGDSGVQFATNSQTLLFSDTPVPGGHSNVTLTVKNIGTGVLANLGAYVNGGNAGEFQAGAFSVGSLAPGAATTVNIAFSPLALGVRNATLQIGSNDPSNPLFAIGLDGIGVGSAEASVVVISSDQVPDVPSATFTGYDAPASAPSGNIAFRASIGGEGVSGESNVGIWVDSGTASELVARTNDPAPGVANGVFAELGDPILNDSGAMAVRATLHDGISAMTAPGAATASIVAFDGILKGPGINATNNQGIWTKSKGGVSLVGRTGNQAAGCANGARYGAFVRLALLDEERVIFQAHLNPGSGGVSSANADGVWQRSSNGSARLLLRKGMKVKLPGGHPVSLKSFSPFSVPAPKASARGALASVEPGAAAATIPPAFICKAKFSDTTEGIVKVGANGGIAVAASAASDPHVAGAAFGSFSDPAVEHSGQSVFKATLRGSNINKGNSTGIWTELNGRCKLVARMGAAAPGVTHSVFSALGNPVTDSTRRVAFIARLSNGKHGVWRTVSGRPRLLALSGQPAPGCPWGAVFQSFSKVVLLDNGNVIFLAELRQGAGGVNPLNGRGVWRLDPTGGVRLVVRAHDSIKLLDSRSTIADIAIFPESTVGVPHAENLSAQTSLVYRATFTTGAQAIVKASVAN